MIGRAPPCASDANLTRRFEGPPSKKRGHGPHTNWRLKCSRTVVQPSHKLSIRHFRLRFDLPVGPSLPGEFWYHERKDAEDQKN